MSNISGIILDKRDNLLFKKLKQDFKKIDINEIRKIEPILNGKSKISLRIIEWFITSFSKRKHIYCKESGIEKCNGNENKISNDSINKLSIYRSYKNNLNAYHGKHFSIFKRTRKINIKCDSQSNLSIEPSRETGSKGSFSDETGSKGSFSDEIGSKGSFSEEPKAGDKQSSEIIINTTIAQLNLFKWILENKLLNYIEKFYSQICKELYDKQQISKNYNDQGNQGNQGNQENQVNLTSTVTGKNTESGEVEIMINWN
jgi:hypothetical protein